MGGRRPVATNCDGAALSFPSSLVLALLLTLQARPHAILRNGQHTPDVFKPRLRKVIEISKPVLESASASGVLDGESDLLQRHAAVVVAAEHIDAGFLERAEETAFPSGLIVLALAFVRAIPNSGATEKRQTASWSLGVP